MYNTIERDNVYIKQLLDFISSAYNLEPIFITPAKRGYFGETWRLYTANKSYFLKLDYSNLHKDIYKNSFHIIQHLNDYGVDFISRIIKTQQGELSSCFDSAVIGIFDWIDGENIQDERTKIPEYQMLAKVYTVPTKELSIPRENFSTESADLFFAQCEKLNSDSADKTATQILELFKHNQDKINHHAERLKLFSERCKTDTSDFYITHGDAGGNIIMNSENFYIVDWDDPILAPPERDAWFCRYWDWAMDTFNKEMQKNSINYTLHPERLAYYCYHMFFWYMTEHLETYFEIGNRGGDMHEKLIDYFSGWIEEELKFADTIK